MNNNSAAPDLSPAPSDMATIDMNLPPRAATDHPPLPQMTNFGGPTLDAPELWTVVWSGQEQLGYRVVDYTDWLLNSDEFWTATLTEYSVGKGKSMGLIVLNQAPPATIDDSQLTTLVRDMVAGTAPATSAIAVDANTVFSFIIPENSKQTMFGGTGCVDYDGYHNETRKAGGSTVYVPYIVNLQCPGQGFEGLMETVSHEASETATDPHPNTHPGYYDENAPSSTGGEIADLCNPLTAHYHVERQTDGGTMLFPYSASRNWSNKAAAAGNADPCVPAPTAHPYFNVAVNPADQMVALPTSDNGADYYAVIEPYSFGDVGPIKWEIFSPDPNITLTPSFGTNNAGDSVFLTIHVGNMVQSGTYALETYSQSAAGGENYWTGTITLQ